MEVFNSPRPGINQITPLDLLSLANVSSFMTVERALEWHGDENRSDKFHYADKSTSNFKLFFFSFLFTVVAGFLLT